MFSKQQTKKDIDKDSYISSDMWSEIQGEEKKEKIRHNIYLREIKMI